MDNSNIWLRPLGQNVSHEEACIVAVESAIKYHNVQKEKNSEVSGGKTSSFSQIKCN